MMEFFTKFLSNKPATFVFLFTLVLGFAFLGTGGDLSSLMASKKLFMMDNKEITESDVRKFEESYLLSPSSQNISYLAYIKQRKTLIEQLGKNKKNDDDVKKYKDELSAMKSRLSSIAMNMGMNKALLDDGILISDSDALKFLKENWIDKKGQFDYSMYRTSEFRILSNFLGKNQDKLKDIEDGKALDKDTEKSLKNISFMWGRQLQKDLYAACFTVPVSLSYAGPNGGRNGWYHSSYRAEAELIKIPFSDCQRSKEVTFDDAAIKSFYDINKNDEDYNYLIPGTVDITCLYAVSNDFVESANLNPNIIRDHYESFKTSKWFEKYKDGDEDKERPLPFSKVKTDVETDYKLMKAGQKCDVIMRKALAEWQKGVSLDAVAKKYQLYVHNEKNIHNNKEELASLQVIAGAFELSSAFNMGVGEISSKTHHAFKGPYLFRVDTIVPNKSKPFIEVKQQVINDLKKQQPKKDALEILNSFKNAYNNDKNNDSSLALKKMMEKATSLLGNSNLKQPNAIDIGLVKLSTDVNDIKALEGLSPNTIENLIRNISQNFGNTSTVLTDEDNKFSYILIAKKYHVEKNIEGDESFGKRWETDKDSIAQRKIFNFYGQNDRNFMESILSKKIKNFTWN